MTGWDVWPSHFDVSFEIRRAPLPDLVAHNLTPFTASNGKAAVRMIIQNVGAKDAGPFQIALREDGREIPVVTYDIPELPAGETRDAFYFPPDTGEHRYALTIDEPRTVPEMDETNNALEERIAFLPATVGGPQDTGQSGPCTAQCGSTRDEPRPGRSHRDGLRVTDDCDPARMTSPSPSRTWAAVTPPPSRCACSWTTRMMRRRSGPWMRWARQGAERETRRRVAEEGCSTGSRRWWTRRRPLPKPKMTTTS